MGAGARLIELYDAVAARGQGVPAGSCASVGVTGLTLGGGMGVLSRAWGLTCDDLVAARVVTADGQVRDCDEARDADLFWALRGGGGGSFGVVTSLTLRTHSATALAIGFLSWPWSRAAVVVSAWQVWMSRAPDALWSTLHLQTGAQGPEVTMHAVLTGTASDLASRFGIRSIFWAAAIPGALCVLVALIGIHETKRPPASQEGSKTNANNPISKGDRVQFPASFYLVLAAVTLFSLGNSSDMFLVLRAQNVGIPVKLAPLLGLVFNITYTVASWPAG